MSAIYTSADQLIGHTPLLELTHIEKAHGLKAKILAKLEYFNPGGSIKDRAALQMLRAAEQAGRIGPGALIIEPTSGNTGIGLAAVARAKGYHVILTMPDTMSVERIELLKERQKFFDQRNAFNKLIRERSRQEELNEILVDAVKSGNLPQLEYEPCHIQPSDNDLLVSLNDIHYGANVDNHWNTYNSDICREMMCHYLDRIIAIAETHGSENCIVWSNGDAISGNIHQSIACLLYTSPSPRDS